MKKGLIALFSGLGVVGILILLLIIGSIIGVVVWYIKKKKEGYWGESTDQWMMDHYWAGTQICRNKYTHDPQNCIKCSKTTGLPSNYASSWCYTANNPYAWHGGYKQDTW